MKSRFTDLQFSTTHHTPTDREPSLGSLFRTKNTISYKNIQADHCQKTLVKNELPIFIFDLSGIKHILNLAHQAIHELRESHPGVESNVIADYRSPWKSHTLNAKLLPLCDVVSSLPLKSPARATLAIAKHWA